MIRSGIGIVLVMWAAVVLFSLTAHGVHAEAAEAAKPTVKEAEVSMGKALGYFAVAIVTCVSCLAAGFAVGTVGAAAMGACAERPELIGRALIFVGLAEGIAIYGLIIAVMLLRAI